MGEVVRKPTKAEIEREKLDLRERTAKENLLLRYARLSPAEIAEKTGLEPGEVISSLADILQTRDWMTERMEERLLLIELGDFIESARSRQNNASEDNYADIANVVLRGYEAISKRLDARRKLTEQDMNEISRAQGERLMQIISLALNMAGEYVSELHPDIYELPSELEEGFRISLPRAREEIEKNVRQ